MMRIQRQPASQTSASPRLSAAAEESTATSAAATHAVTTKATTKPAVATTAALPASTITPIPVPFRGRELKVAGDRTIDVWTVSVINDENFIHRRAFEAWMQNIAQYGDHSGLTNPNDYMGNAIVYQLGRSPSNTQGNNTTGEDANILAQYRFIDIFPTAISEIGLSYDQSNTIEEFTVEFQVQYWFPERAGTGA